MPLLLCKPINCPVEALHSTYVFIGLVSKPFDTNDPSLLCIVSLLMPLSNFSLTVGTSQEENNAKVWGICSLWVEEVNVLCNLDGRENAAECLAANKPL